MRRFIEENWLWILAPVIVVALGVGVLLLLTSGEGQAPFRYALF